MVEYLALPDASAIASHMRPANSASAARQLIQDAEKEAWRIRLELAKTWDANTLDRVEAKVRAGLDTKADGLSGVRNEAHPLIGPLMSARFPDGAYAKVKEQALLIWQKEQEEELKKEAAAARAVLTTKHKKGAKIATQARERRLMIACVESYVKWAKVEGKTIGIESIQQSPKADRMSLERTHELLGTLVNALAHQTTNVEVVMLLNERHKTRIGRKTQKKVNVHFFKYATQEAVAECMGILRKAIAG